jgi:hypothetical protein
MILGICLASLVGCSGNQQKLEACMKDAEFVYIASGTASLQRLGCVGAAYAQSDDKRLECVAAAKDNKVWRLEAEDRCVKLYK